MSNGDTASEFSPKTFARFCKTCNKKQTFEAEYRLIPMPQRNSQGEVVGISVAIEPQPHAHCQKCKTVIFIGHSIQEEFEELKESIEEANRRATSGLVVPKGSPSDLVIPGGQ